MPITVLMVTLYILYCIRIGTKPCKYFQLNSKYFDQSAGIFSKLKIDELIPSEWRLHQRQDDEQYFPENYPVFLKPEWGQNARGIFRADNKDDLQRIRKDIEGSSVRYLLQEGAQEKYEFELFAIRHHSNREDFSVMTLTQAINESERFPINSIYNDSTRYEEITDTLSPQQSRALQQIIMRLGDFRISRTSIRADSIEDLCEGRFHIIEINLFLPMPINLLDIRRTPAQIFSTVRGYMWSLAMSTKFRDKSLKTLPVFTKIMMYNRESHFINFIRSRI